MRITLTKSYPVRIWEEDIVEAMKNLWMEELKEKLEKYKADNPGRKFTNYEYAEKEYSHKGRIFKEMTISFKEI